MIEDHGVVNVADALAVMVDHNDILGALINGLALNHSRHVRIHNDDERTRRDLIFHLVGCAQTSLVVGILKLRQQFFAQRALFVHNDARGLMTHLTDAPHADRAADAVEIGHLVAHDDNVVALHDQIVERRRDDTALDFGALFHAARYAAVELKAVLALDGGLVTAAAERHVERLHGHFLAFAERIAQTADARWRASP